MVAAIFRFKYLEVVFHGWYQQEQLMSPRLIIHGSFLLAKFGNNNNAYNTNVYAMVKKKNIVI